MEIKTEHQLDEIMEKLSQAKVIAFDFETRPSGKYPDVDEEDASLHHKMCEIEGLALRSESLEPVYINFLDNEISRLYLNEKLRSMFSQDSLFVAHNIQFDAKIADYFFGARPKNKFCTLIGYWYYDENEPKSKVHLSKKIFGIDALAYKEAKKLGSEAFLKYTLWDVEFTYRMYSWLKENLTKYHFELVATIEMWFVDVLIDMTLHGTPCDLEYLKKGEEILVNKALELEAQIYKEYGEFNLGSPQQLCEKLYGIKIKRSKVTGLQLTPVEGYDKKKYAAVSIWNTDKDDKTKRTTPSTNDKALARLDTPIAKLIQEYRGVTKLLNTYAIGYQKYVIDGRIHPTFNNSGRSEFQYGTVTGRLSSSAPNMQNISHNPTEGWWLREAIYAPEGYDLVVADESQLEIRLLAHWTKDPVLIKAIKSGEDIHKATAKLIFKKDDISKEERYFAKTMNFSVSYGQGIKAIAEALYKSVSQEDMQKAYQFRKNYFNTFSTVARWIEYVGNFAASPNNKDHHVKTILGRKRRLGDFPVVLPTDDEETEKRKNGIIARNKRQAVNSIIQGSASDVLKVAMYYISKDFKAEGLDAHIILQIHDELVVECKKEDSPRAMEIMQKYMEQPFKDPLEVPLEAIPKVVYKWSEAKD